MKGQKAGFSLVEFLMVVAIIGLLIAIAFPSFKKVHDAAFAKGTFNGTPDVGVVYEVMAVDNSANTVIAISYDSSYTNGTLGRVMLRVSDNVCHVGTHFSRSSDGIDHLMAPFKKFQTDGWVEQADPPEARTNHWQAPI